MFTEVREMIDSTVYTNGRSEVTAQNVNLAMHGIVDATEDKLEEVENNIEDIKTQLSEGTGNAVALSIQFPMVLVQEFIGALPDLTINNMLFTPEIIDLIGQELPVLVEPLNNIIEENRKIFAKCSQLLQEGKDLPIINVNAYAGFKELVELESPGASSMFNMSMIMTPLSSAFMSMGGDSVLMLNSSLDGATVNFTISPEGYVRCEMITPGNFIIPAPTNSAYDNSGHIEFILSDAYENTHHTYEYQYGSNDSDKYFITPLIVTKDDTNMYVRFLVGLDILEGAINLTNGNTTSRIVGSITPAN